ncbi:hypothetical protein ACNOYE_12550 [Nannocystaceae bacterium ST9]
MRPTLASPALASFAFVGLSSLSFGCVERPLGGDELGSESSGDSSEESTSEESTSEGSTSEESTSEESTSEESTSEESTSEESTSETSTNPDSPCTSDEECGPGGSCYVVPFVGGVCGECNEDIDCPSGGCTPPNPSLGTGPVCNQGEFGAGCESDEVCADGLQCGTAIDLVGLITIESCGTCLADQDCLDDQICAPLVALTEFYGVKDCIAPNSLAQNSYCDLNEAGEQACASGICSSVDIQGLAQIGACGECNVGADCPSGLCMPGAFVVDTGELLGSTCL